MKVDSRQRRRQVSPLRPRAPLVLSQASDQVPAFARRAAAAASRLRNVRNSTPRVGVRFGRGHGSSWVDALIRSDVRGWPAPSP